VLQELIVIFVVALMMDVNENVVESVVLTHLMELVVEVDDDDDNDEVSVASIQ
jgi:hypothetical protein